MPDAEAPPPLPESLADRYVLERRLAVGGSAEVWAGTDRVLGVDNRLHRGRIEVVVGPTLHPEGEDAAAVDELTRRWADWVGATLSRGGGRGPG